MPLHFPLSSPSFQVVGGSLLSSSPPSLPISPLIHSAAPKIYVHPPEKKAGEKRGGAVASNAGGSGSRGGVMRARSSGFGGGGFRNRRMQFTAADLVRSKERTEWHCHRTMLEDRMSPRDDDDSNEEAKQKEKENDAKRAVMAEQKNESVPASQPLAVPPATVRPSSSDCRTASSGPTDASSPSSASALFASVGLSLSLAIAVESADTRAAAAPTASPSESASNLLSASLSLSSPPSPSTLSTSASSQSLSPTALSTSSSAQSLSPPLSQLSPPAAAVAAAGAALRESHSELLWSTADSDSDAEVVGRAISRPSALSAPSAAALRPKSAGPVKRRAATGRSAAALDRARIQPRPQPQPLVTPNLKAAATQTPTTASPPFQSPRAASSTQNVHVRHVLPARPPLYPFLLTPHSPSASLPVSSAHAHARPPQSHLPPIRPADSAAPPHAHAPPPQTRSADGTAPELDFEASGRSQSFAARPPTANAHTRPHAPHSITSPAAASMKISLPGSAFASASASPASAFLSASARETHLRPLRPWSALASKPYAKDSPAFFDFFLEGGHVHVPAPPPSAGKHRLVARSGHNAASVYAHGFQDTAVPDRFERNLQMFEAFMERILSPTPRADHTAAIGASGVSAVTDAALASASTGFITASASTTAATASSASATASPGVQTAATITASMRLNRVVDGLRVALSGSRKAADAAAVAAGDVRSRLQRAHSASDLQEIAQHLKLPAGFLSARSIATSSSSLSSSASVSVSASASASASAAPSPRKNPPVAVLNRSLSFSELSSTQSTALGQEQSAYLSELSRSLQAAALPVSLAPLLSAVPPQAIDLDKLLSDLKATVRKLKASSASASTRSSGGIFPPDAADDSDANTALSWEDFLSAINAEVGKIIQRNIRQKRRQIEVQEPTAPVEALPAEKRKKRMKEKTTPPKRKTECSGEPDAVEEAIADVLETESSLPPSPPPILSLAVAPFPPRQFLYCPAPSKEFCHDLQCWHHDLKAKAGSRIETRPHGSGGGSGHDSARIRPAHHSTSAPGSVASSAPNTARRPEHAGAEASHGAMKVPQIRVAVSLPLPLQAMEMPAGTMSARVPAPEDRSALGDSVRFYDESRR